MTVVIKGQRVSNNHFWDLRNRIDVVLGARPASPQFNYGQNLTAFTPANLAAGTVVTAAQWEALRADVEFIQLHQTGANTFAFGSLPPQTRGRVITAAELTLFNSAVSTVESNAAAFMAHSGSLSALTNNASSTRSAAWSADITSLDTFTFQSYDAARYFFNAGGQIRVTLSHPTSASSQNQDWFNFMNAVGTLQFGASGTSRISGNRGTVAQNVGFYSATIGSGLTFLTADNAGGIYSGAYSANDVRISARVSGAQLIFTVMASDDHVGVSDSVSAGTTATYDLVVPNVRLTVPGFTLPTFSTTNFTS